VAFSFSFGGVRSEYKDIIINKVKRNIAPPINTRSMSVPNRDGIYFYRNDLGSKTVEFDITVEDTSQPNLRKTVERIATFLEPKNGLQELIVDDETDRLYYAILSNDTSFDQLLSFGKTTLVFLVPDGVSHSTSSLTHFVSQEPAAVFTRASTAYTRDLTGLGFVEKDNNVPRYETCAYTKGIYVEEHTTNLLTAITSMANGSSQFTTIGTGTTIATTRSYAIVNLLTLRLRTPGLTSPEGTSIAAVAITAGLSYTFSVYLRGHGTVKLQSLENDGGATTTDSVDLTLNQNAYQRLELTFTAQAGTTTVVLKILTTSRQSVEVYFDALQLERKAYSSSWTKGGLTRAVEFLKVKTTNKLNGQQGTIDFFFKKVSSPSTFGAFFDWGLFSAGPTVDRLAISHGTGFGSGIDVVRMEISNTGLQQKILTLDTNVNLVIGRPYYLAARWYLVGSAQGMVKLTLVDLENNTSYQITEATTINAPKMTAFSSGFVGSVTNSTAYRVNAVYEDLRFSPIIRNDTDIDDSWKLRKPLLKDTDASVKYTWNETLYGTLVSNEGSAYGYPIITFHQTLASTHIYLDIYPTTSRFEYLTTDGSFFDSFQINTSGAYMNNFFGSTNNTNDEMTAQSQFPVLTGDHYFLSNDTAAQITLEYTPRWL
jgi:predicted phage tail component-like protein